MSLSFESLPDCRRGLLALLLLCAVLPVANGALVDIASEPVISQLSAKTKPNLMFVLDDSESMDNAHMPDDVTGNSNLYGYSSSQCNGVAYDPSITYTPPVRADGTSYPNADFTNALLDGYRSKSNSNPEINLRNNNAYDYYYVYSGNQARLGWTYDSNGQVNSNTVFYNECRSQIGDNPGRNVFARVDTRSLGDQKQQSYANWFSYYRKRYLMMRTAVGHAMQKLDANTRVGFSRINVPGHTDGVSFRDVRPFDPTQKSLFYDSLYSADPKGGTPLRGALAKVGRYYAKRLTNQTYDPVEYACQRNYALLTTDGYWNNGGGSNNFPGGENSSTYGPISLFGSLVGQQDANEERPMKDSSGTQNTLADVAQYYYATDLRTPEMGNCTSRDEFGVTTDVCNNNVPVFGRDLNTAQHLTTFTVGFGVNGTLRYSPKYLTDTTGDYSSIIAGSKNWPAPGATATNVYYPGDARNIDDLWHAAVNGRGQYYSALDSTSLVNAIVGVAATIKDATGAGAAASFNTLAFVPGDNNRLYQATYTSPAWTGDVRALEVNGDTGKIGRELWSAAKLLEERSASDRKILYRQKNGSTLREFNTTNLTSDAYLTNFADLCDKVPTPGQCVGTTVLDSTQKTKANTAANLVNYLRGDRSFEATNTLDPLYRTRKGVLGDIIHGAPVFVGKPPFGYSDAGYPAFVTQRSDRPKMIYAGANDGMLHAFDAETGREEWAFMPTDVMKNLFRMADTEYATRHTYSVDGEPVVGDIMVGGVWKTILVGGLGAGGRSYYALDITDPLNPKFLWEFTNTNLGLSYANPIITKRLDGTWIVAVTSGLNNTNDGLGRLFILDANTGANPLTVATTAGNSGTPSGLMRLNAWVEKSNDNTALRFYAGDMLGNLWRFDIDDRVAPFRQAQLLAQFQTPAGAQQPITTPPELLTITEGNVDYPVVVVGTGRYIGSSDISDKTLQSIYAVKDPMAATSWGNARAHANIVKTNVTVSGAKITATNVTVNWTSNIGWYFDLPTSGERVVTPMSVLSSTLAVGSTVPGSSVCSQGGSSWFYRINMKTGLANGDVPFGELFSSDSVIIGLTGAKLSGGTSALYVKDSAGVTTIYKDGIGGLPGTKEPRRSSWRELVD